MSKFTTNVLPLLLLGVVLSVVGGAILHTVTASSKPPDGPVAIAWDKAACVACGMHVGEPPFAAQLTDKNGKTVAFDDTGCLFAYVDQEKPDVHAIYFRHHREDRWVSAEQVAFVPIEVTPMGFGLGAVDAGTAGSIGYDEARRKCLLRVSGHGDGR